MQKALILELVFRNSILLFGDILFIYYLVKRENIAIKFFDVEDKKLGKILSIGLGVALIYAFIAFTIPSILDIPYLARNEYCVIDGVAENNSLHARRATSTRQVKIRDEEQESIRVCIVGGCGDISIGDELTVKYLPHTHYGCVVEHTSAK